MGVGVACTAAAPKAVRGRRSTEGSWRGAAMARPLPAPRSLQGVRVVLTDGAAHAVDSNELAFRLAAIGGFRAAYADAGPTVLEPVMKARGAGGGEGGDSPLTAPGPRPDCPSGWPCSALGLNPCPTLC